MELRIAKGLLAPLLSSKPKLQVDRLISLGGLCEVAYQLRRIAKSDRAYPFDWWITPLRCLPIILSEGPAAVFACHQLRKVPDYDGHPAMYSHLGYSEQKGGTIHLHEFGRDQDFLNWPLEAISLKLVEKYTALQNRMVRDASEGKTVFVRQFLPGHDPEDAANLEKLVADIELRLSDIASDYTLLLVDYCTIAPRPRVLQGSARRYDNASELGSDRGWTEMFAELGMHCRLGQLPGIGDLLETLPAQR